MTSSLERVVASPTTRRTFLKGSGLLTLGGLVAACGGSDDTPGADAPADKTSQTSETDRALDGESVEVWRDPG